MNYPRNVAILVFDDVEVLDFCGPYEVFNVASEAVTPSPFYVYSVGIIERPIQARGRFTFTPHYTIETSPQADVLIVPGGYGIRPLIKHGRLLSWITDQANKVERLISVCTGALLLAKAGLLESCEATTHHSAFDRLKELSPTTTVVADRRFVQTSQRILTAAGISAGIDVALHVVNELAGSRVHGAVVEEMEYNWETRESIQ
jgi:transcriptional regulator GlxA family with amidase domain